MNFYKKISEELARMKQGGSYKDYSKITISAYDGAYFVVGGKKVLNFSSNNYLGLAWDKRLKRAAKDAVDEYGVGTASVRALVGTNTLHVELEKRLAEFKKMDDAVVVTAGYMANLLGIQTLLGKEDVIISDELNHASVIDAIRLAQVKNKFIYKHNDIKDLRSKLPEIKKILREPKTDGGQRQAMIVTDGVFSMDGDLAPLPELSKVAKEIDALLMVDDAHGEGILGDHGRGISDYFKLHGEVDIEVGTLSKAFGVNGGFITGKKELIEYFRQRGRQFLFSNALSIPDTASLIEAVKILQESDARVKKLWENALFLQNSLKKLGFDTGKTETPITPVMLGEDKIAFEFAKKLLGEGVMATPIVFPMVPRGTARLRLMPSAAQSKSDLKFAISKIKKVGKTLGLIK